MRAENRLAKSLWEQGDLAGAREHYQKALALDPTNRIAERNIDRQLLLSRPATAPPRRPTSKAPVAIFVEETGKTGFAHLVELARPKFSPRSTRRPRGARRGSQAPHRHLQRDPNRRRRAARRRAPPQLIANGNKYAAGVTSLAPRTFGSSSARPSGSAQLRQGQLPDRRQVDRPAAVHQGHPAARGRGLEEDLEDDIEDEEIEDLDRVIRGGRPTRLFEDEPDELEEP